MNRQIHRLSAQMDFEKEDILDNPAWEYVGTYIDIKSGRTISSKPGFQSLLADCEAGKIDMISKSISRSGRNCVDFVVTLGRLKELNVDVFSTTRGYTSPEFLCRYYGYEGDEEVVIDTIGSCKGIDRYVLPMTHTDG